VTFLLWSIVTDGQILINGVPAHYDSLTHTFLYSIPVDSWGEDFKAQVTIADTSHWTNMTIEGQTIDSPIIFQNVGRDTEYTILAATPPSDLSTETLSYEEAILRFTYLPIISFNGTFSNTPTPSILSVHVPDGTFLQQSCDIKWRGSSTNKLSIHKHSYKIKLLDLQGNKVNYPLLGLRNDNSWVLDAATIDLFRFRNIVAADLWNSFAALPYYASQEKNIHTATRGELVELFINQTYQGIYTLCEPIDRKQMKLKKFDLDSGTIHGGLWKSVGWNTFWDIPEMYDNTQPTWGKVELKYPKISDLCPSDYSTLYNAMCFLHFATDQEFIKHIADYIDLPVFIDYYLFVNLLNAFDLCGKNIYWAVYDREISNRITPAMWDMDCTAGQNYTNSPLRPDYVSYDTSLLSPTYISDKLLLLNPDNYYQRLQERYIQLRQHQFSLENLSSLYNNYYNKVYECGASRREEDRWSYDSDISGQSLDLKAELHYILNWLEHRLELLDVWLSSPIPLSIDFVSPDSVIRNQPPVSLSGIPYQIGTSKGIIIVNHKKYIVK